MSRYESQIITVQENSKNGNRNHTISGTVKDIGSKYDSNVLFLYKKRK